MTQPPPPWPPAGSGSLEGPTAEPPKRRKGLLAGLAGAVVLVAGGVVALVLLTGSGDGGSSPDTARPAPRSGPAALAQAAVDALNARSAAQYGTLVCTAPGQPELDSLQRQWTDAAELRGAVSGAPELTGTTATVEVTVTYNGRTQSSKIPMKQQGQDWCIDES
ncbi:MULTISPECIES: hypothetical protein [Amycolatopsis]|uniref:DUF4878 domain-containing protein n=2 Tax=Amycolatopsis TaxID=1813 RepID=A0A1I3JEW3_9PSEU|nr:hypothetical protein [Amycolatopsis sacchari]SFI58749.1 hypothetical protein SAMN05421835_101109 [Amycolatopsis sacchari]